MAKIPRSRPRDDARARCSIHERVLICPACIGAKGGRTVTPRKREAIAAMNAKRRGGRQGSSPR